MGGVRERRREEEGRERCSSTVSDDNRVIRPNTANAAYLFLVIKKKVDAANSEHQQWPQTLSVWLAIVGLRCWHVFSPFYDVIERRACETVKNYRQHYVISCHAWPRHNSLLRNAVSVIPLGRGGSIFF